MCELSNVVQLGQSTIAHDEWSWCINYMWRETGDRSASALEVTDIARTKIGGIFYQPCRFLKNFLEAQARALYSVSDLHAMVNRIPYFDHSLPPGSRTASGPTSHNPAGLRTQQ